jgi:hypothetical protein
MALRRVVSVTLPLLWSIGSGLAQTPPDGQFAVTIRQAGKSSPPQYSVVPEAGGSQSLFDCSDLARVPDWETLHPDDKRPSIFEIVFKVVDDAVVMTATAYLGGKFDVNDTPDTLALLPRKTVGTYKARVNESVTLTGMTEVGLQPVTVEVVTARDPGAVHPMFISEVPSVQIAVTGQNREFFTLALHNVASRAVAGFSICAQYSNNGGTSCRGQKGSATHPVIIAAGATLTIPYALGHSGRDTPNGFIADPDPPTVVLNGVVFADGGAEGLGVSPLAAAGVQSLTQ